ncbi:unnamed protein product [Linum tenue]|uniref:C2 domain-containing protein n=1 Tax=Linum tenue TaxID=586396 RepID=A0AAV0PMU9_9ROSI|nr:unnamed protein product [Linum tenue]
MSKATLEILLVNASGIRRTNLIGKAYYYVIIECGDQQRITKLSSSGKDHKTCWNQKFRFEAPVIDWKRRTHLKLTILDTELFKDGEFVGETIIYLGGIVAEGKDREVVEMKPAPYNVVLHDGTFKGQIKLGIKFKTVTHEMLKNAQEEEEEEAAREIVAAQLPSSTATAAQKAARRSSSSSAVWEAISSVWKSSWWKFWSYCSPKSGKSKPKSN